jgi:hypothetical protein
MKIWKIFSGLIYLFFVISCSLTTGVEITRKTNATQTEAAQTDDTRQNVQFSASETSSGIQIVLVWVPVVGEAEVYKVLVYSGQDREYVSSLATNKSMIVIDNIDDGVYYYEIKTGNGKEIGICGPITIRGGKIVNEDVVEGKLEFDRETFERERALWETRGIANYEFTFCNNTFPGVSSLIKVLDNKPRINA